jgi:hypothetical protein
LGKALGAVEVGPLEVGADEDEEAALAWELRRQAGKAGRICPVSPGGAGERPGPRVPAPYVAAERGRPSGMARNVKRLAAAAKDAALAWQYWIGLALTGARHPVKAVQEPSV